MIKSLDYFAALVQQDNDIPLFEAALTIAQDDDPRLDLTACMVELDKFAVRLKRRLPTNVAQIAKLRLLNNFFYQELGFAGNVNDYYDPDNSFVNVLLRTRRGIPISLAVLWMELAQGLGLPAQGVGFPGHFMVKVKLPMGQAVIGGIITSSLLTLVVVPVVYCYLDDLGAWLKRKWQGHGGHAV